MDKIKEEKLSIEYDKKQYTKRLEEEKELLINLLNTLQPEGIVELESYSAYREVKRLAAELKAINAKLRVIDYITEQ